MSDLFASPELRLEPVRVSWAETAGINLQILRLDQIHPLLSGNKWYKLRLNLREALKLNAAAVLSFGGAYSNHLHALAWAGHKLGMPTIAVVRGEAEYAANPTLTDARKWGMQLHFVDRQIYRRRHDPDYQKELLASFPGSYIVPEGGSNALAVKGFYDLFEQPCWRPSGMPDLLVAPCGTGGTLAGLITAADQRCRVLGMPVLKKADFLYADIAALVGESEAESASSWALDMEAHFGGYGKISEPLLAFMKAFEAETGIELDPVYTGKMMFRLHQLITQGTFEPGAKIVAVHTGGLQGRRGFIERGLISSDSDKDRG